MVRTRWPLGGAEELILVPFMALIDVYDAIWELRISKKGVRLLAHFQKMYVKI